MGASIDLFSAVANPATSRTMRKLRTDRIFVFVGANVPFEHLFMGKVGPKYVSWTCYVDLARLVTRMDDFKV